MALDLCTSGHENIVALVALCYETCASRKVIIMFSFIWFISVSHDPNNDLKSNEGIFMCISR